MFWQQEVVFRKNTKNCDVYYIAPPLDGSAVPKRISRQKKRSPRDILQHFISHPDEALKLEQFSFEKKPLGILCKSYETVPNTNEKNMIQVVGPF